MTLASLRSQTQPHLSFRFPAVLFLLIAILGSAAMTAQTLTVLHSFHGADGQNPGTVILDRAGNVYGTNTMGGGGQVGNVYKLAHAGSGWVLSDLYDFHYPQDGSYPHDGGPAIGPDGALYGTTQDGGSGSHGTIYKFTPPVTFCRSLLCPWNITTIHAFSYSDGGAPRAKLVFDASGNMYGTTNVGGQFGAGTIFMATRSGGGWNETVLYSFDGVEGSSPSTLAIDSAGNLYGTVNSGRNHIWGAVFELSRSGSGWTYQTIYSFTNGADGRSPVAGLALDSAGNLYGSTPFNGQNLGGTIFQLSPSNGSWTFNLLYSLSGNKGPLETLTVDSAGNLYGTTNADGAFNDGSVFELSPSGGGWTYTDVYDFTGGEDGKSPVGGVAVDANGNLFGTNTAAGRSGFGVVFELTR